MSDETTQSFKTGAIISADLTVPNTEAIFDFYRQVVGWTSEGMPMEDADGAYEDYVVKDEAGNWVGGVCRPRGPNVGLPPVWLIYVQVADVRASLERCEALGGKVIKQVALDDGTVQYAIIQDPAGAYMALTHA